MNELIAQLLKSIIVFKSKTKKFELRLVQGTVTEEKAINLFYFMDGRNKKKAVKKELDVNDHLKKLAKRIKSLRIKAGYTSYEYFAGLDVVAQSRTIYAN